MITLIAALAENYVIGFEGHMPWRLRADLAHFKRETLGKPIIMGRKTFESIGKPLPSRQNIVISRTNFEGVTMARSIEDALQKAEAQDVMVIGGGEIYKTFLPLADRLILTHVHAKPKGDAFFPQFMGFKGVKEEFHAADINNDYDMTFKWYEKH